MRQSSIKVLDFETQNHPWYGELASPRCPDNYVVMYGHRDIEVHSDGSMRLLPRQEMRHSSKEHFLANKTLSIPDDCTMIVAHNAPYEISWFQAYYSEEFNAFLKRGGRVFCTAYAEYLLTHQQDRYPALDEVAPKYGGSHKVDGIKVLWEQGYLTSEIDPEMLSEYLSGPEGDVENTTKVFLGQYRELHRTEMLRMALIRMEGMLAWSECMRNGLYVDRDVAERNMAESNEELEALRVEVLSKLPADMPIEAREQFKFSSDYHMSAFIFGGVIKYKARVPATAADGELKFEKVDAPYFKKLGIATLADVEFDNEAQLWYHVPTKEHQATYASGKHKGLPKFVAIDSTEPKTKWGDLLYTMPGLAPIADLPHTLRTTAQEEWVGKRTLADGTPVYSSAGNVLEALAAHNIDGCTQINRMASLDKDIGTYYLREEFDADGNVRKVAGAMQFIQPSSIIHHTLNMTSTVTGRLSSNRPNMQNIPRSGTSKVKQMFTSRFGEDGLIIEADYSALEVVGLCAFSKDVNLERALLDGIDMHCMRLSQQLGEDYASVYEKCHNEEHPDNKRYDAMRTAIKPKAFQYQYGATAYGIAFSTGCTVDEAQAFIDAEQALFPQVEAFFDNDVYPTVQKNGERNLHREQTDDGRWVVYRRGHYRTPDGTCYSFREWPKRVRGQEVNQFKPTEMRNYPIQGSTGFWVQGIGGLLFRYLLRRNNLDGKLLLINQVHDAFYFDCHKDVVDEAALLIKGIMEVIPQYYNHLWPDYNIHVPFPAEVKAGPSMYKSSTVKVDPAALAEFKTSFLNSMGIKP